MDDTHERQDTVDNPRQCACREKEEGGTCYVLMNSREYGTEVWPCEGLDEAVETLSRLAWSAETASARGHVQRYFCILGEWPEKVQEADCDPVSPDAPDTDALTLHFRETPRTGREPVAVPCLRLFPIEEAEEVAA